MVNNEDRNTLEVIVLVVYDKAIVGLLIYFSVFNFPQFIPIFFLPDEGPGQRELEERAAGPTSNATGAVE